MECERASSHKQGPNSILFDPVPFGVSSLCRVCLIRIIGFFFFINTQTHYVVCLNINVFSPAFCCFVVFFAFHFLFFVRLVFELRLPQSRQSPRLYIEIMFQLFSRILCRTFILHMSAIANENVWSLTEQQRLTSKLSVVIGSIILK